MKSLLLIVGLMFAGNGIAAASNNYRAIGYAGAAHITTELTLKTMNALMNENDNCAYCNNNPSPWNHAFSSVAVFTVLSHIETTQNRESEQTTLNIIGIAFGVLTGNLFQIEW